LGKVEESQGEMTKAKEKAEMDKAKGLGEVNKVKGKVEITNGRTLTFPLFPFYFTLAYRSGPGLNFGYRGPAVDARDPAADPVAGRAGAFDDDNLVGDSAAKPA